MTDSDWGPDSPADDAPDLGGPWLARFGSDSVPDRPISAAPDEHFPPAELDGYRLLAANEVTRVATYRQAADTHGPVPASTVAQGVTNPPNPPESAISSGNDGSGDLSPDTVASLVALARVIDPDACDPPAKSLPIGEAAEVWRRQDAALLTAKTVWDAGYRLVSDDEATVDRVARRIAAEALGRYDGDPSGLDWTSMGSEDQEEFRFVARAAVRALLGEAHDA